VTATPSRSMPSILRIGTRPSALAMAQTGTVADRLRAAGHRV
jgi:hydroxymethylbilane synthase